MFIPISIKEGVVLNVDDVSSIYVQESDNHPELVTIVFNMKTPDEDGYQVQYRVEDFRTVKAAEKYLLGIFQDSVNIQ